MNSGIPGFDPRLPHPLPRGRPCPAALSRPSAGAALPGGNSFPRLDPGLLPCRRLLGRGQPCGGLRGWWGRRRTGGVRLYVRHSIPGGFFLLQQRLHTTPRLIGPTGGSILDLVAAVVAGLPPLGGLPELAAQALCSVIQPTADKLLGNRYRPFLQPFFTGFLFSDFCDNRSPPEMRTGPRLRPCPDIFTPLRHSRKGQTGGSSSAGRAGFSGNCP